MSFKQFKLSHTILKAIDNNYYIKPTPIQRKVIPIVLENKDVLAKAQTGSGKTASFVFPILELLHQNPLDGKAKIRVLVLAPTRELVLQIEKYFNTFSNFLPKKVKVISFIGGESLGNQLHNVQQGCDILVSTPGRFLDILSKKQMNLTKLEYFILDEADKMLDLGFLTQLDDILDAIPNKRQNLLFSATYPQKMLNIASKITSNPTEVYFEQEEEKVVTIIQRVIEVNKENRNLLLKYLLKQNKWDQVLVFMANKKATDNIAAKFRKSGYLAESFHGDLIQEDRNYTLEQFKAKRIKILFATDLVSRGIDIDNISCVINYDLPRGADDYIHRIGRTGRAGKSGVAISFIDYENQEHFKIIEKRCNLDLKKEQIEGFELTGTAPIKEKGKAPIKGKRKSKKDKLREENL